MPGPYPSKDTISHERRRSSATVLQFDMDGNQRILQYHVSGENFNQAHALHCAKGRYTHMRHNENRDSFPNLMKDICSDVELELKLQPLEGESFDNRTTTTEDGARLDIQAISL